MVVVLLSAAVTAMVTMVLPAGVVIGCDAEPEFTGLPFTLMVAFGSAAVGVMVVLVVPLGA